MRGGTILCGAIAIVTVLGFAQRAQAVAMAGGMQEQFDYPTGTNFPNTSTLNGGIGWNATGAPAANAATANWGSALNAGTARTATTPGLTFTSTGYFAASGNKFTMDGATASQNIGRNLGGQTINDGSTYFSLLMSKNNDTIRTINLALFDGTVERMAVGQIGATAGNSAGNIALLMNNSNPAGLVQNTTAPIAMGIGVTHLIVGRIDWNASGFETVSIWVDPTSVVNEAAMGSAYITTSGFELTQITAIRPFVGNAATVGGNPVPGVSANFDEIRFGSTFELATSQAVAKAGDVNGDTIVDINDFNIIRDHFQQTVAGRTLGDLNFDGQVNFLDYRQWKNNVAGAVAAGAVIPEPATAALGAFAMLAAAHVRRKK